MSTVLPEDTDIQFSIEPKGQLQRQLVATLDSRIADKAFHSLLGKKKGNINLNGFRPGKVPTQILIQRFGQEVWREVILEVANTVLDRASEMHDFEIAGHIEIPNFPERTSSPSSDPIRLEVNFEVYPIIPSVSVSDITIQKPVVTIAEEDVDELLSQLAKRAASWEAVERGAQSGDRVIVDLIGKLEDKVVWDHQGNKRAVFSIPEDLEHLPPGPPQITKRLIGCQAGAEIQFQLPFPEDFADSQFAGKSVDISMTVISVTEERLPKIDEDFAKQFEIEDGSVETLRKEVTSFIENDVKKHVNSLLKERMFGRLLECHKDIEVPEGFVENEMKDLVRYFEQNKILAPSDEIMRGTAILNVRRTLLVRAFLIQEKIQISKEQVEQVIADIAASYENPQEALERIRSDENALSSIHYSVLEQEATKRLMDQVTFEDVSCSFQEFKNGFPSLIGDTSALLPNPTGEETTS